MLRQFIAAAALTSALALSSAACASRYDSEPTETAATPDSVYIDTYNENFYDARVHAIFSGGQRRSLGTVPGNGGHTRTALPWEPRSLVFEVVFIIDGAAYVSHPVDVARSESVELRLPPNMSQSGNFRRVSRNQ
jgi:hypothetical protein